MATLSVDVAPRSPANQVLTVTKVSCEDLIRSTPATNVNRAAADPAIADADIAPTTSPGSRLWWRRCERSPTPIHSAMECT